LKKDNVIRIVSTEYLMRELKIAARLPPPAPPPRQAV
jgi:hypothetical protein